MVTARTVGTTAFIMLSIDCGPELITANEKRSCHVVWQNLSNQTLRRAVLQVVLPGAMNFEGATAGSWSAEDNTLTYNIGNLNPGQSGELYISASTNAIVTNGEFIIVTASLVYTNPGNVQEEAIAYSSHRAGSVQGISSNLSANVSGAGWLIPGSLLGWLLLLIFILLLALLIRNLFTRTTIIRSSDPDIH